jgi:hypothetical protein
VGPRPDLDPVEKRKIVHSWESNPGSPSPSRLLHRLSFPGHIVSSKGFDKFIDYLNKLFKLHKIILH